MFEVGNKVSKKGGDYRFDGVVVAAFEKLSGERRYVVEDDRGVLHVYSDKNLILQEDKDSPRRKTGRTERILDAIINELKVDEKTINFVLANDHSIRIVSKRLLEKLLQEVNNITHKYKINYLTKENYQDKLRGMDGAVFFDHTVWDWE